MQYSPGFRAEIYTYSASPVLLLFFILNAHWHYNYEPTKSTTTTTNVKEEATYVNPGKTRLPWRRAGEAGIL